LANVLTCISVALNKIGVLNLLPSSKVTSLISMPLYVQRVKKELKELEKNVDKIVVLTLWYKEILLKNKVADSKISFIPQAIATLNTTPFFEKKMQLNLPIKLIFIGRIQPQKGVKLLIKALKNFTEQQITIDIYGKIEATSYYTECKNLSINMPHVRWKGVLNREDVLPTIAQNHLLCLPSLFSEMSPLVIQEAFAANTPVLASKVYGNMEQIKNGVNGVLVDFNSIDSIILALQNLVSNPTSIVQMSNQIKAASNFIHVGKQYLQVYQSC
jgi:glycosyltransferase involved in cell wall biosynthesis